METKSPSSIDLPKAQVKRIVKTKLNELTNARGGNVVASKDALTAIGESGRTFISLLTNAANAVCRDAKRSTITGDDILQGLHDIGYDEFTEPLRTYLAEFRSELKEKNKKKQETRQHEQLTDATVSEKEQINEGPSKGKSAEAKAKNKK